LPATLIDRIDIKAQVLTDTEAEALLPVRKPRSNKGSFGKILVFAGSNEMPGAAALVSSAAYMVGGGLVCACVLPAVASVIHHWQREVITRIVPDKNGLYCKKSIEALTDEINQAAAIVLGPGIGRGDSVTEFVREIIEATKAPIVLDADALFAVSEDVNILKRLKSPCVITPHPGEMSRLTKLTVPEILDNTIDTAVNFSKEFNVVTLLKDARTIAACPDGNFYINTTGNNALSKAGTGDVLSGMIAGFIAHSAAKLPAQDALPVSSGRSFTAAMLGAYSHGKAGEAAALRKSCYGVIAADLLEYIPSVINELANSPEGGSAV
jgi:NAD(P)H-hydrate epimerase